MDRYQEAPTTEGSQLARIEPWIGLRPHSTVQDDEDVVVVLIDLGALDVAQQVFQVERVEVRISLLQTLHVCSGGTDEVRPDNAARVESLVRHPDTRLIDRSGTEQ